MILLSCLFISLGVFGRHSVEAKELKNSEKWLMSIAFFNKTFPNNDEMSLATLLTDAKNWPSLHQAHNLSGFSDDLATFPDKLRMIDPDLYSEIKKYYDRVEFAYKMLDNEEKQNVDKLFAVLKDSYSWFLLTGRGDFWSHAITNWEDSLTELSVEKQKRIRSAFPFLIWLPEYWSNRVVGEAQILERAMQKLFTNIVDSGLHEKVLNRTGESFDYEMIMEALNVEDPTIYVEVQPIARRLRNAYMAQPEKQKRLIFKSLEWFFENREIWIGSENDFVKAMRSQEDKIQELRELYHDLSRKEQEALGSIFPLQLGWIKNFMALYRVDVYDRD